MFKVTESLLCYFHSVDEFTEGIFGFCYIRLILFFISSWQNIHNIKFAVLTIFSVIAVA